MIVGTIWPAQIWPAQICVRPAPGLTVPGQVTGAMSSRILVVEDDERIRTSMRLALEDEG